MAVTEDLGYSLKEVPATRVAAVDIDATFKSNTVDLISSTLGGTILTTSDEWFAEATNLINPKPPVQDLTKFVFAGRWYDGWETRRHNPQPFDYVIIRLGVASGIVSGVEVDTAFFSGNHAPFVSVEGVFSDNDEEVISWGHGRGQWSPILSIQEGGPSQRLAWKLNQPSKKITHVRLNMYPDGGIARFRLFGRAIPVFPSDPSATFDLAAAVNGGVAISCSNQQFGNKDNLLLPGRGVDMGDGWETARSRGPHEDWTIIRLGARGVIERVVVDTAHFRGNFPQRVRVEAICWMRDGEPGVGDQEWAKVVEESKTGPDKEHEFECADKENDFTHVKLVMIPDGGIKRIRVFGRRELEGTGN